MTINRRIVGVSLGALVALTAAGSPPVTPSAPAAAIAGTVAYFSPLADAKPLTIAAAPATMRATTETFQPAEWRVTAKSGDAADPKAPVAMALAAAQAPKAATKEPAVALDDRNMECLARAVYYEARGEPIAGQAAVAHVILNRKKSGRFPTSVCGVVDQPGQFTFRAGRPESRHPGQWARARQVAAQVAAGEMANPVGPALFFHADHVSPGWRRPRVAEIGNHIFYR
jgi:spore germination cell wall hydrolase CwlJ-like protein